MKKFIPFIIIAIVLILLLPLLIPSVRIKIFGIPLKYKFVSGTKSHYGVMGSIDTSLSAKGIPQQLMKDFPLKNSSLTLNLSIEKQVEKAEPDSAQIKAVPHYDQLTVKVENVSVDIPIDRLNRWKPYISYKQSPSGEITDITAKNIQEPREGMLKEILQVVKEIKFPQKPIRPGDTWQEEEKISLPTGTKGIYLEFAGNKTFKFEKTEKYNNRDCALITYKGDLSIKEEERDFLPVTGIGTLTGTLYFDYEKGEIAYLSQTLSTDLEVNLSRSDLFNMIADFNMSAKIVYKMEMERK